MPNNEQPPPHPPSSSSSSSSEKRRESGGVESVADIRNRLRQGEDYNMAIALQEQEFSHHYNLNRNERRTMAIDHKLSKEQQMAEQKKVMEQYLARASEIAKCDEKVARELQKQVEEEEARMRADEELARRLQEEEERSGLGAAPTSSRHISTEPVIVRLPPTPNNTPSEGTPFEGDEDLARTLQERYYQRFSRRPHRHLDENTQNEVNVLVDSNVVPARTTSLLPLLPTYSQCLLNNNNKCAQADHSSPSPDRSFEDNRKRIVEKLAEIATFKHQPRPAYTNGMQRKSSSPSRSVMHSNTNDTTSSVDATISQLHPKNPFLQDLIDLQTQINPSTSDEFGGRGAASTSRAKKSEDE